MDKSKGKSTGSDAQHPSGSDSIKEVRVYKGDKDKLTKAEWWLISITAVLAVCNIFVIIYASNQSSAAIQAVNDARKQFEYQIARDSVNAHNQRIKDSLFAKSQRERDSLNNYSIKLAKDNFQLTEENAKIRLRPYIVVNENDTLKITIDKNLNISSRIKVTNVGETPALNYFQTNAFLIADNMYKEALNFLFEQANRHKHTGLAVGSKLSFVKIGSHGVFTSQDSVDVFQNNKKFYFYGVVGYSDVFNDRHFTWYCLQYDIKRQIFIYLEKYNGMK